MFIGLTIYNLESDNVITALHRPLLSSEEQEVHNNFIALF